MSIIDNTTTAFGRARYAAAQGLRSAWYGAHYLAARRTSGDFTRPGETPFSPESGPLDTAALRTAFLDLFIQDRANIEAGLYSAPQDVRFRDLARALRSSRAFFADVPNVDRRRTARQGTEVRETQAKKIKRYPTYYRQNFHYQSDGWLSDESARIYDTQVETLFTGAADAMRRAALAEIASELKGQDQRHNDLIDIACGTGRFLAQIMRSFPKLRADGLDLSPNYAALARQHISNWSQVEIIEGAAEDMPVESESYDLAVSIYLFHELPPRIRPLVFSEIERVLRPGGAFIFADSLQFGDIEGLDPILEYFPEGFHEPYYKGYLKADLATQMEEAGLIFERQTLAFLTKVQVWRKPAAT
ncbi:MAG: class I SAM-dependent methyltransferase [Pseudomonadota bacterium]